MNAIFALITSVVSLVLQTLRLRNRAEETENALEDSRDEAAVRLRHALSAGHIGDAAAARADHDSLSATLEGRKPKTRTPRSPKR